VADESVPSDKEHLIGRAFGPDGAFDGGQEFNFIFRACLKCNGYKAALERHLSSVTVFNSPARLTNESVNASAIRKASNDFHPADGRTIEKSHHELTFAGGGPGFTMKFGLVAPPQADSQYVHELAFMHIQGFFSLVTTKDPRQTGTTRLLPPDQFQLYGVYNHGDWGNLHLAEITHRISNWKQLALVNTARGFFRAVLLRQGIRGSDWFWALEWNQSLRIVGAITDNKEPLLFKDLPALKYRKINDTTRMRTDTPLDPLQDTLFSPREFFTADSSSSDSILEPTDDP
jgi:hypothetical protein